MRTATILSLLALAGACKADDPFDEPLDVLAPVGTRSGIVYMDLTHDEAILVTPDDGGITVDRVAVGPEDTRARWCVATRDATGVLVLTVPESEKDEDVQDQLHLLRQDGDVEGIWDLAAPFSDVALSPDGRHAVLYFGGSGGGDVLENANLVAIVELGGDAVRTLTLNGFGGRVRSIEFPGQREGGDAGLVDVGGRQRDLVAFLAEGEVVLVDAADPAADQVAVRFGDVAFSPQASMIRPADALFDDATLFLRGGGDDVAMLTLVDKPDETTGIPGFSTQVSLIPVGLGASDFTVYNGDDVPYLVTVGGDRIVFTDIRTQGSFEVELEGSASHLALRQHETPLGPVTQAVAWADGGNAIHTLELDAIEDTLGRAPRRLLIETGIEALVRLDNDRVLVGSGTNLYVVDFRNEQVTPLRSSTPYDPQASALEGDRLLLGTPGQSRLSTVDLVTLDPESMLLDATIESFFHLPDRGVALVVHPDPTGYVTVAEAAEPSRATSFSVWGVLLEGELDR